MRSNAMRLTRRIVCIGLLLPLSLAAHAGGWGVWSEVTKVEVIRNDGFLIFGTFSVSTPRL